MREGDIIQFKNASPNAMHSKGDKAKVVNIMDGGRIEVSMKYGEYYLRVTTTKDNVEVVDYAKPIDMMVGMEKSRQKTLSKVEYVDVSGADLKERILATGYTLLEVAKMAGVPNGSTGKIWGRDRITKYQYEKFDAVLNELEKHGEEQMEEVKQETKEDNIVKLHKELKKQLGMVKWMEYMEIAMKDYNTINSVFEE